jgi:hypothetical protein
MIWIIDNQVSRRSLPKYWRGALQVKRLDILKKIGKANMGLSPGRPPKEEPDWLKKPLVGSGKLLPPLERKAKKGLSNLTNLKSHDTRKEAADNAGVSAGTFHKIAKIEKQGSEDLKRRCMNEEISVDAAYKELRGLNSDDPPVGDIDRLSDQPRSTTIFLYTYANFPENIFDLFFLASTLLVLVCDRRSLGI